MTENAAKEYTPKKNLQSKYIDICDRMISVLPKLHENVEKNSATDSVEEKVQILVSSAMMYLVEAIMLLEEGDADDSEPRDSEAVRTETES